MSRPAKRAAAAVAAAAGVLAGLAPIAAWASPGQPASGGSTVTLLPTTTVAPAPTTTTTIVPTVTTTPAATTTTTKPARTTTTKPGSPPATGVPSVPVGGPPTTAAPKGSHPPPPPNPEPILAAVQADLSQLSAIAGYHQAQALVAARRQAVTLAAAEVQAAHDGLNAVEQAQKGAQDVVATADSRLRGLALAAYVGLGYATPASGPGAGATGPVGTVTTPGGLTGTEAADAQEMLRIVAQREKQAVVDARRQLAVARRTTARAAAVVARAEAGVGAAQAALTAAQQHLAAVTQAATEPGAIAGLGLLTLPGTTPASASATPAPGASAVPPATPLPGAVDAAANVAAPSSPSILGSAVLNGTELAQWFAGTGHQAHLTVKLPELAADYQKAGLATGVRYDLAFAQSVVETGYFSFPSYGQLTVKDNNFAGIGACDTCAHGWTFPNALTGVSAQLELLEAYASVKPVKTPLIGSVGVGGCCPTWMALAGKWASSLVYGISILTVYHQMLTWVIPHRLQQAGLIGIKPAAPAARGPTLAPLPSPAKH